MQFQDLINGFKYNFEFNLELDLKIEFHAWQSSPETPPEVWNPEICVPNRQNGKHVKKVAVSEAAKIDRHREIELGKL